MGFVAEEAVKSRLIASMDARGMTVPARISEKI